MVPDAMQGRSFFGDLVLLVFLLAQVSDGALTYLGVHVFGFDIEANPVVAWYIAAFGVGIAVIFVKMLAVACAATLHLRARHRTIGLLAILYLGAAVWPWTNLLSEMIP